ncbi:glycine-rich protein family [Trichomonas vaginalis G3]|nr:glycine-rich protein family [Trichomonas vaginalis G3]KAI5505404.1 glycine-rich protein family [Trichomonas vaginalis G3]
MPFNYKFSDLSKGENKVYIDNNYVYTFEYPCKTTYDCAHYEVNFPPGKYLLEVWGAQGGVYLSEVSGPGGYSKGILTLKSETKGFLYIGGKGTAEKTVGIQKGGFNGGGNGYFYGSDSYGAGGGGASDIRLVNNSLKTRIIVAGGGGGSSYAYNSYSEDLKMYHILGGAGGGYQGGDGAFNTKYKSGAAYGATQSGPSVTLSYSSSSKAEFGNGGSYTCTSCKYYAAGGGGGWFGGAAAGGYGYSGAGGSGYVLTSTSFKPKDYIYKREHFLMKASMKSGIQYGNGVIRITLLDFVENENIKIHGCGLSGFSFSQLVSFITLPSVE